MSQHDHEEAEFAALLEAYKLHENPTRSGEQPTVAEAPPNSVSEQSRSINFSPLPAKLREVMPEAWIRQELASPPIQNALIQGRNYAPSGTQIASPLPGILEVASHAIVDKSGSTWWSLLRDSAILSVETAWEWLCPEPSPVMVVRNSPNMAMERTGQPDTHRFFSFSKELARDTGSHCVVWTLNGDVLTLIHPRLPGDATAAEKLAGRQLVVQCPSEGSVEVILALLPSALGTTLTRPTRDRVQRLEHWLTQLTEATMPEGVTIHTGRILPHRPIGQ